MTPVDNAAAVLQSGRQFPSLLSEPSFDECIEQGNCYRDDRAAGRIDLRNIPEEHFIAYYGGRVLDHDLDPTANSNPRCLVARHPRSTAGDRLSLALVERKPIHARSGSPDREDQGGPTSG